MLSRRAFPEGSERKSMTGSVRHIALAVLAVLPGLVAPGAAGAQSCPDAAALTRGVDPRIAVVRFLADDALEGRLAGSAGERCAGDYLASAFERLGLEPGAADGSWFQEVPLASAVNPHAQGGTGRNVVGILRGADPAVADEYIVVGAHYDHLGTGGFGSLAGGDEPQIHNGADDNASGVAALLAVAGRLTGGERPARSIVFVAFTGEEMGLLGSARFVSAGPIDAAAMKAMLNMDMVGRLEDGALIVYGVGTAREWQPLLVTAAAEADVRMATREEGYGPSDHTSFYARDIPVLHFFTNVHGDYHRPGDDWEKIDVDGLERVGRLVARLTGELAGSRPALTLVRGAGAPPATGTTRSEGYGAWLGTVPDFSPVERGVLLGGVSSGSPAETAGLRAGDVLIGIGEHEVVDLQAMTDALRAHRPGESVDIRYVREGREHTARVTLGSRAAR